MRRNVARKLMSTVINCTNVPVTYSEFWRKSKCVHYVNRTLFVVITWKITFVAHFGTFSHNVSNDCVRFGISAILTENVPFKISHFTYFHIFFTFMCHICETNVTHIFSHLHISSIILLWHSQKVFPSKKCGKCDIFKLAIAKKV